MNRIKYISGVVAALLFTISCSEAEKEKFSAPDAIYFKVSNQDENRDKKVIVREDTLIYSFAYEAITEKEYTIKIPIEIVGERIDKERTYKVKALSSSTAKEGVHYKSFSENQIIRSGKGVDTLAIIALRHVDLLRVTKDLALELVPSNDFALGRKESIRVFVRFSDMLEQPEWWAGWKILFGEYHYIKHQEWIRIAINNNIYGPESKLPGDLRNTIGGSLPWGAPYELMAIRQLKEYFQQNPRYTLEDYPEDPSYPGARIVIASPY